MRKGLAKRDTEIARSPHQPKGWRRDGIDLFGIDLGLGELAISFKDLLAAFVGSFIFPAAVQIVIKQAEKRKNILSE